tara:strand:+ start:454 stop:1281 length:828 start_codon:yes stop_codon:yes gene_type:complete
MKQEAHQTGFMREYRESQRGTDGTAVLWTGLSALGGGAEISVIASRAGRDASANPKTGDAVQIAILETGRKPQEAYKGSGGVISSACPQSCPHLAGRADDDDDDDKKDPSPCYLKWWEAPTATFGAAARRVVTERTFADAYVRLGYAGDPSAAPLEVLEVIVKGTKRHTGYTADWMRLTAECGAVDLLRWQYLLMASTNSPQEAAIAQSMGWRTFSCSESAEDDKAYKAQGAELCPNVSHNLTCSECGKCDGTRRGTKLKSIFIPAHGAQNNYTN